VPVLPVGHGRSGLARRAAQARAGGGADDVDPDTRWEDAAEDFDQRCDGF